MTLMANEKEIELRLKLMTLTEKVALLSGRNAWFTMPIKRLDMPSIVMTDGPHGVRTGGEGMGRIVSKATAYPTGVSMASSWNRGLIERVGHALAEETRYLGCHILLGPCVNIVRSPLGGRNFETYAEDPYLTGQIGIAYVRGLQNGRVGASVKHFAANNQEFERNRGNSVVDERTLREIYLPAFEAIVKEAKPWTVMCSYNRINGTYASAHETLLRRILKEEWGFEGVVVSDWGAVHDIYEPVSAGLDLEMPGPAHYFGQYLEAAVNNWQVDLRHIDDAVRRMLRLLFWSGALTEETLPTGSGDTHEHRQLARELAGESMVLLKNEKQRLPLNVADIKKLAVIGLNADREVSGGGSSRVDPHHWVTPLAGLRAKLGDRVEVHYSAGYDNRVQPIVVEPDRFSHGPEGKEGLKADFYNNLDLSGAPVTSRVEPHIGMWWGGSSPDAGVVDEKCFSVRWTGIYTAPETGDTNLYMHNTGVGRLWLDGELILENEVGTISSSEVDFDRMVGRTTLWLEKDRHYELKVEFISGELSQYALMRLLYLPPLGEDGDLLASAVDLAGECDAAIVVAGLPDSFESEGYDRPDMDLPGDQATLIRAVAAANPNTIIVVNAGAPVAMPWAEAIDGILLMYYPGQEGGHALADILFGDVNPSGKLTVSYPKRLEDNPAFINYPGWKDVHYGERLFVGYRYYDAKDVDPLFPFGHGLSYSAFTYDSLTVPDAVHQGEHFKVTVQVTNTSDMAGAEVLQLYVRDVESTLRRPLKELKGFEKVFLLPGESQMVTFELDQRALAYYDSSQGGWVAEPGQFEILIGASSQDIRLKGSFELIGEG